MKAKFFHHPNRSIPAAAATLAGVLVATSSATAATIYNLGTLGGTNSVGVAVNDGGQVAGGSQTTGSVDYHAFRYDGTPGSGGSMRDLGTLGGMYSQGRAINSAGQVAGWSEFPGDPDDHAFLYVGTPGLDGQMIDLDAWLNANDPTEGTKWKLKEATGLSDTGWIAGTGTYDPDGPGGIAADSRAYLLDASSLVVPEPSGAALLIFATAGLWRRRNNGTLTRGDESGHADPLGT